VLYLGTKQVINRRIELGLTKEFLKALQSNAFKNFLGFGLSAKRCNKIGSSQNYKPKLQAKITMYTSSNLMNHE